VINGVQSRRGQLRYSLANSPPEVKQLERIDDVIRVAESDFHRHTELDRWSQWWGQRHAWSERQIIV